MGLQSLISALKIAQNQIQHVFSISSWRSASEILRWNKIKTHAQKTNRQKNFSINLGLFTYAYLTCSTRLKKMFCASATERRISFSLSPVLLLVEWLSELILICKTKGLLCYCFWLMDSFHFSVKNVPLWSLSFQKYSKANFKNPYDS